METVVLRFKLPLDKSRLFSRLKSNSSTTTTTNDIYYYYYYY